MNAVLAYPAVELWLKFLLGPRFDSQPLKPPEIQREMREHREKMLRLQGPRVAVVVGDTGAEWLLEGWMPEAEPGPGLVEIGSVQQGPAGHLTLAWLHPLPDQGMELALSVNWPEAGLPEGRVPLDVPEIRSKASSAQKLVDIDIAAEC